MAANDDVPEADVLLLQRISALNLASTFREETAGTTHFHPSNHHASTSSESHKRPSSENPTTQPSPKKPNNTTTHPFFAYKKIPVTPQTLDGELPPPEEPPLESPGTPLSKAIIGSNILPPSPTLERSVPDLVPSPAKDFSNSSDCPRNAEWEKKMKYIERAMNKVWKELSVADEERWKELLDADEEPPAKKESENRCVEHISIEKDGKAQIVHLKCPCGSAYQVVFVEGRIYYQLI